MNKIIKLPFRFFECLKDYGLTYSVLRVFHLLRIISVLHSFDFVFKELASFSPESDFQRGEFTYREIFEIELDKLNYAKGIYPIETLRIHFSKGMRFFAAFHQAQIIAVNGMHTTHADLIYIAMPNIKLPEKVAYSNCALTAPAYRNHLIGTHLRSHLLNVLCEEGFKRVFGAVFIENKQALRWNLRNGFQYCGRISYIKWGNKKLWFRRFTPAGRQFSDFLDQSKRSLRHELVLETTS